MVYNQHGFDIRCEWGAKGIEQLAASSDAIIIVDVLSFTTCVSIAVDNEAVVYPFYSDSISPEDFAREHNAILAGKNRQTEGFSLSPASLITIPPQTRVVIPSPNGSMLSTMTSTTPTFAGCLRNARAVAEAAMALGPKISVIPAGERWLSDYSVRFALEDWIGAGAIIRYLAGAKSYEAQAAENAFLQFRVDLRACLEGIGSGRELIEKGFADDVMHAAALNVSDVAPHLVDGAYMTRKM
ncbi:MAG: 2-phosphosulfolactate phosphatase [Chloroflexi bacterium]|nr:2-phosphosulfolactate phosphatase [Chloroflexota bacterium]